MSDPTSLLAARVRALGERVAGEVVPLVWEELVDEYFAETRIGTYEVLILSKGARWWLHALGEGGVVAKSDYLDGSVEAKAAAEADHAARVRACLVPQPGLLAEIEALVREAREEALGDALAAQPSTAENPHESTYQRGRFDGIMDYGRAIFALRRPIPASDGDAGQEDADLGNTFTIQAWKLGEDGYGWVYIEGTQSIFRALWVLWRHRRAGGCVTLEVRLPLSDDTP